LLLTLFVPKSFHILPQVRIHQRYIESKTLLITTMMMDKRVIRKEVRLIKNREFLASCSAAAFFDF